ncbi:MAG: hypothetical protein ACI376_03730 [Candidatus Bruticola sp.]
MRTYRGTMRLVKLEGASWMLETPEHRYPLQGLPNEFQLEGLKVEIEGEEQAIFSYLMAGKTLVIHKIRRL